MRLKKIVTNPERLIITLILSVVVYFISSSFDIFELIAEYSRTHESYEIDEIITVAIFLVISLGVLLYLKTLDLLKSEEELALNNTELKEALSKIKQLEGVLPICANCKKIRDGEGEWQQMESYIHNHSEASFSHGMCPECEKEFYKDLETQI